MVVENGWDCSVRSPDDEEDENECDGFDSSKEEKVSSSGSPSTIHSCH